MSSNISHQQLLDRIQSCTANIGIIGLGYVGLPLAVEFARKGFNVCGFDVDESKTNQINAGKSYIPDVSTNVLADVVKAGRLQATSRMGELANMATNALNGEPVIDYDAAMERAKVKAAEWFAMFNESAP